MEKIYIYYKERGKEKKLLYTPGMKYEGDNEFVRNTITNLHKIHATDKGKPIINRLTAPDIKVSVRECHSKRKTSYDFNSGNLYYDDNANGSIGDGVYDPLSSLSHEIKHAHQDAEGKHPRSASLRERRRKKKKLQIDAIIFANYMRSVYELGPMRTKDKIAGQKIELSADETFYNSKVEKIRGFMIQQKWFKNETAELISTENSNTDKTRVQVCKPGIKNGQNMIYTKTHGKGSKQEKFNEVLK